MDDSGALPRIWAGRFNHPRGALNLCEAYKLHRAGGRVHKNADSNGVIGPRTGVMEFGEGRNEPWRSPAGGRGKEKAAGG